MSKIKIYKVLKTQYKSCTKNGGMLIVPFGHELVQRKDGYYVHKYTGAIFTKIEVEHNAFNFARKFKKPPFHFIPPNAMFQPYLSDAQLSTHKFLVQDEKRRHKVVETKARNMSTKNGGAAFPLDEEGMTMRQYYKANAPETVQWDFEVKMDTERGEKLPDLIAGSEKVNRKVREWDKERTIRRAKLWPSIWADAMLKEDQEFESTN